MFKNSFIRDTKILICAVLLTVIYVMIMSKLLFFRGRYYADYSYNLQPFETIGHLLFDRDLYSLDNWIKNLFGNIVLFIPLGFILPMFHRNLIRILPFLISVIVLLFIVEFIQLVTLVGSFDVDDIILNTFGAFIGFLLTKTIYNKMHVN
ncbi:MAG: VanZ family protein [Bacillota bacterium]